MTAAPPVPCTNCGHVIGKHREHYLLPDGIWCLRCLTRHDAYDQLLSTATRAGIHRHHPKANP